MYGSNIRFHVVLCSHNGAAFIEEQIVSILAQGDGIAVVHVHDFASSDRSREVLDRLKTQVGSQIDLHYHADAPGAAASFMRALQQTAPVLTERSLVFLADQDDVWLPEKLVTISAELGRRRLSLTEPFILFHDVRVVDDTLQLMRPTYYTGNPFRVPRDLNPTRLLMANPAIGHTMLMSPALINLMTAWPDTDRYMMHDWLAVLIASRVGRVEHIPSALSLYRQHENNVLGAYRTRPGIASVGRLLRFADRVVVQAVGFARAAHNLSASQEITSSKLEAWCRYGYRPAAFALAAGAVMRGPTWQRKAISLLLLARAIAGPANGTAKRRRS